MAVKPQDIRDSLAQVEGVDKLLAQIPPQTLDQCCQHAATACDSIGKTQTRSR